MGTKNCSLSCFQDHGKSDLEIKSSVFSTQDSLAMVSKETLCTEPNLSDSSIISIQSLWRCFIQRKHYQFLKKLSYSSSFFPQLDLLETLGNTPVSTPGHHSYTYISGTVYEGDWLGGFRHGQGKATWPEGSTYEGEWNYGYPFGLGKFTHSDGEVFVGTWINPYSSLRQQACDSKNSETSGYSNS